MGHRDGRVACGGMRRYGVFAVGAGYAHAPPGELCQPQRRGPLGGVAGAAEAAFPLAAERRGPHRGGVRRRYVSGGGQGRHRG